MGPDFSIFLSKIVFGALTTLVLSVGSVLAVVYFYRTGSLQVLSTLLGKYEAHQKNVYFEKRYQRERKNAEYRQWRANRR